MWRLVAHYGKPLPSRLLSRTFGNNRRVPPSALHPPVAGLRWAAATTGGGDRAAASAFMVERGYSPEVAEAVVATLAAPSSGTPPGQLLATVELLAGRWEVGEDAGLEALAKSVEQEMAREAGKHVVRFSVRPPSGSETFACEGFEGMSLKDISEHGTGEGANLLAEYIECACSGVMACSTCHVYVDPDWIGRVGPPSEAEMDMLELAYEPSDTSRLGCQLRLKAELEGMVVSIPGGANNMFDDIPFD